MHFEIRGDKIPTAVNFFQNDGNLAHLLDPIFDLIYEEIFFLIIPNFLLNP